MLIGYLSGKLIEKNPPSILLNVSGVGYELQTPISTAYKLPESGGEISLWVHMVVREDAMTLYGFVTKLEKEVFAKLVKINGVGPKLALAILSHFNIRELLECVSNKDITHLLSVPGIGKKTAERLAIELYDRLSGLLKSENIQTSDNKHLVQNDSSKEAIQALVSLGYSSSQANTTVNSLSESNDLDCESLIKASLKLLARN